MAAWSPTLEGFRTVFRRPSLPLAEVMWRWSFGAAACVLLGFGFLEYLDTLPVSNIDLLFAQPPPFADLSGDRAYSAGQRFPLRPCDRRALLRARGSLDCPRVSGARGDPESGPGIHSQPRPASAGCQRSTGCALGGGYGLRRFSALELSITGRIEFFAGRSRPGGLRQLHRRADPGRIHFFERRSASWSRVLCRHRNRASGLACLVIGQLVPVARFDFCGARG